MRTRISKGVLCALVVTATTQGIIMPSQSVTKVVAITKGGTQPDPEPTRPGGGLPLPKVAQPSIKKMAAIKGIYCKNKAGMKQIINAYNAA